MRNTSYNTFAIVITGFTDSESDTGNDIMSISSDILGISNWKNRYTRFIKNMLQSASTYLAQSNYWIIQTKLIAAFFKKTLKQKTEASYQNTKMISFLVAL